MNKDQMRSIVRPKAREYLTQHNVVIAAEVKKTVVDGVESHYIQQTLGTAEPSQEVVDKLTNFFVDSLFDILTQLRVESQAVTHVSGVPNQGKAIGKIELS